MREDAENSIKGASIFTGLARNIAATLLEDTDETPLRRNEISESKEVILRLERQV